jgi:uncharacterized SAM-binding protein YcdF (DUF218 family)
MFPSFQKLVVMLTYPPALTLCLLVLAVGLLFLRYRGSGGVLMTVAVAWSVLWSIPLASDWLRSHLERQYPVLDEARLPEADAIVVLGGGGPYTWMRRAHVRPEDLPSSRLAAGARAWQAGRAPVVILSGGGENGESEARRMAAAITRLGVPESSLLLEERSRSTRDNARFTAALAERHGMHRVLLVTSSVHMPRAVVHFRGEGIDTIPVPIPERARRTRWTERWLPSRSALWRSGRAIKEYGGLLMAHLQS